MRGLSKGYESFEIHFQRSGGFVQKCGAFKKILRLFDSIFREIEAF
jgi:hypothetical protein